MANSIIKEKQYVPAQTGRPYRPYRPAYVAIERREICGYVQEKSPGKYKSVRDPQTGLTTLIWVPDDAVQPIWKMAYKCRTEETKVNYPAVPEQSAITSAPARFDYNMGWNTGARSRHSIAGDGRATFCARASIVGAICGLNGHEDPVIYNGASIKFGFYFTRGIAKVMELGVFKSASFPYTDDSVFRISREGGQVTYWMDDVLRFTSGVDDSAEDLWLQASLYSGGDEIFDPVLEQISEPEMTEITGSLHLALPATYAAMRSGFGAAVRLKLPAVGVAMTLGLPAPEYALLSLVLAPPVPQGRILVGALGRLSLALAPPSCILTDSPTGRLSLVLPPPWILCRTWPHDTLPGGDGLLELDGSMPGYGVCTLPTVNFKAVLGGSLQSYAEITLDTMTFAGVLGGGMTARGEVTLPAVRFTAVLGGSLAVLSQLNEVFALNIANGKVGGTTQYTSYEFNSAARIGGRYYGASAEGLFLFEGDNDDGMPIDASFGPGQLNFGSPQIKTVPYCYVGASAGAMRMTMDALVNGQPAHYEYPALEHGRSMRELRFSLGRGLRSTYVMPTFYNYAGSEFEVDAVRFVLAESARRI